MSVTATCVNTIFRLACSKINLDSPTYTPKVGKTSENDETRHISILIFLGQICRYFVIQSNCYISINNRLPNPLISHLHQFALTFKDNLHIEKIVTLKDGSRLIRNLLL